MRLLQVLSLKMAVFTWGSLQTTSTLAVVNNNLEAIKRAGNVMATSNCIVEF